MSLYSAYDAYVAVELRVPFDKYSIGRSEIEDVRLDGLTIHSGSGFRDRVVCEFGDSTRVSETVYVRKISDILK